MEKSNQWGMRRIFSLLLVLIITFPNAFAQFQAPKMIFVEGSNFKMGSDGKEGYEDERPVHPVKTESFWIGKYEVTVAEYKIFCKETKHQLPPAPNWGLKDDHPVINVTWQDANDYCNWLSKKTGKTYRLPTEIEWEFAAKGGKLSKGYAYSGSNNPDEVAWYDSKVVPNTKKTADEVGTQPVGKLKPNELGIYDMSGNAWEWCSNAYTYYKGNTKELIQPPAMNGKQAALRVLRGGSWYYEVRYARVTAREGPFAEKIDANYGFRVARSNK